MLQRQMKFKIPRNSLVKKNNKIVRAFGCYGHECVNEGVCGPFLVEKISTNKVSDRSRPPVLMLSQQISQKITPVTLARLTQIAAIN